MRIKILARWCVLLVVTLWAGGCNAAQPIRIGYAAELSGRRGEMGVDGRDGALLAVEQINQRGGIQSHQLELVVRNDQGTPQIARQVDQELVDLGVVAIIGHLTSEMTAAVLDQTNQAHIILLSPTSSSSEFSQQEDYFFRVIPDTDLQARTFAEYIFKNREIRSLAVVIDLSNAAYTDAFWNTLRQRFEQLGGQIDTEISFSSGKTDLKEVATAVRAAHPQSVLVVASAIDTAMLLQYCRPGLPDTKFFGAPWAVTNELLTKGGKAIDGLELISVYDPDYPSIAYRQFIQDYQQRFARRPSLAASHSYEAVLVLADSLNRTGAQAKGLGQALKNIKDFPGLQGSISIDAYGDVQRNVYLMQIIQGRFSLLMPLGPSQP